MATTGDNVKASDYESLKNAIYAEYDRRVRPRPTLPSATVDQPVLASTFNAYRDAVVWLYNDAKVATTGLPSPASIGQPIYAAQVEELAVDLTPITQLPVQYGDPLPWYCTAIRYYGGRSFGTTTYDVRYWDGVYNVLWGGTSGGFVFTNTSRKTITSIRVAWAYEGRNGGWHTIYIKERTGASGSNVGSYSGSMQYFWLPCNVAPFSEIVVNFSGGGDSGDGNNIDYIAIVDIQYAP